MGSRVVKGVGIRVLELANLGEDDADLVRNVVDGLIVGVLSPLGKLGGNVLTLATRSLVGLDQVVLRLDDAVESAG